MSAKHTPGPWEIHGAVFVWSPDSHQVVCAMSEPEPGSGMVDYEPVKVSSQNFSTATANASLIAAAPELLAAAELLMQQYDAVDDFTMGGNLTNAPFMMFRAALAKAKGK